MPNNSYQSAKRKGLTLVNAWLDEKELTALDNYRKSLSNATSKTAGVDVQFNRAQIIRLALRKLCGLNEGARS